LDRPGDLYRAALNDQDEKLLRDIANAQVAVASSAVLEGPPAQCAAALATLERLNVVGLRVVQVLVAGAAEQVRAHVERFFGEGQHCLLHERFGDATAVAQRVRALEAALRQGPAANSTLAADLARSLSLRAADLERLVAYRQAEAERFAQAQQDQKAQGERSAGLEAQLAKVERLNRGLASQLASVKNELEQAREATKTKARQLEAVFLEKIHANEQRALRGDKAEEATANAAALRAELTGALAALHEEAAAREAEIQRAIAEQEALADDKAREEAQLRRDLESAEAERRRESLDAASRREMLATVAAAERKAADAAARVQAMAHAAHPDAPTAAAAAAAQQQQPGSGESAASAVRAESEARLRDLATEHAARLEALAATAAASDAARDADVARALQRLKVALQKAKVDHDPDAAIRIDTEIKRAKSGAAAAIAAAGQELAVAQASAAAAHGKVVEGTERVYGALVAKLEEVEEARAALEAALAEQMSQATVAKAAFDAAAQARAAALEAAAAAKLANSKAAMSANDFTAAKALKAEAEGLQHTVAVVAAGKDDQGAKERREMQQAAAALEAAVAAKTAALERLEKDLAALPKTLREAEAAATAAAQEKPRPEEVLVREPSKEAGHPRASKVCWTSANGDDVCAAGEAGEVVGVSADGQLKVKFSKGTELLPKEQLVTPAAWATAKSEAATGRCAAERPAESMFKGGLVVWGVVLKHGALMVCDHPFCAVGPCVPYWPAAGKGRCFDMGFCCKCAPASPELKTYSTVRLPCSRCPPCCACSFCARSANPISPHTVYALLHAA
jgi:hypothetical protein